MVLLFTIYFFTGYFRPSQVSDQVVLLLETLLEEQVHGLRPETMRRMEEVFRFDKGANADVLHRWCELIVSSSHRPLLTVVLDFLRQHQAMGVYLYGEMLSPSSPRWLAKAAREVFAELEQDMDPSLARSIRDMMGEQEK